MHTNLKKAPIKYVIVQVKFPNIEAIFQYIPELQRKIRDFYPYFKQVDKQVVQLKDNRLDIGTLTQWHFMDAARHTGIILDKQSITIHTSYYEQFPILLKKFEKVLEMFNEILTFSLCVRLGLRYINLIEDGLEKTDNRLQGFQLSDIQFDKNSFLTQATTTQITMAGRIVIKATHISKKEFIPNVQNIFVPPDLTDVSKILSFSHHKEPEHDFLILDLDHFNDVPSEFNITNISDHFSRLQGGTYTAFCEAVGKENLKKWE